MNKIFVLIPVLLMTSCHINDPRPEIHRAMVSVVDDRVCITLPDTKNESISLLTISETGHGENRINKAFALENKTELYHDKCLSVFGFTFEPDKSYVFSVNTLRTEEGRMMKNGNSYSVTFSVWRDNGGLQVNDIN